MSTSSVTGTATTYTGDGGTNAGGTSTGDGGNLNQADFMNLLVTQLQYQDPTNPESNTDFAAQMAQFSGLQQMQNVNTTLTSQSSLQQMSAAAGLIGQTVNTSASNTSGAAISGQVTSVTIGASGALTATIGGYQVPVSDITQITDPYSSSTGTGTGTGTSTGTSTGASSTSSSSTASGVSTGTMLTHR